MNDQRQHPRYAIGLDVSAEHPGGKVVGRTRDLSRGGLCMLAKEPMTVGLTCQVQLALIFAENQFSEHLMLPSVCVWCTPVKGGQHQIGFKFAPLDPQNRGYLDMFMKFLEGGVDSEDAAEDEPEDDPFGGD